MSNPANAHPAIVAANDMAIDFDTAEAHTLLTTMATSDTTGKTAKADRDNASLRFCIFAANTVAANPGIPRETVTQGFVKELDAMRPMLAAEGSPFVEVTTEEGKDTRYSWKGHGANVKSIGKGVTEFIGVQHTADDGSTYDAILNPETAESFTEVKKAVEAARRYGEKDDVRILREAKDALRESIKAYQSAVIKSDDAELILSEVASVDLLLIDWNEAQATVEAIEAQAEQAEAEVTAQAEQAEAA